MTNELQFAARLDGVTGSAIRDIFHLISQPGVISFAGGNPAMSSFEPDVIAKMTREAMEENGRNILQYGATEGYAPLKESTAAYVARAGVKCDPAEVLPVSGGTQAIDLILRALINPGDAVLAEDPTFLGSLQAMAIAQARIIAVKTDEQGAIPESVEEMARAHRPKVVYLIPTFQNPTGRSLTLERRRKMAELAAKYNFILIEDDPYRDLRYAGQPLPSVFSFDGADRVVYVTSYSKVISPGMRMGAAVVRDKSLMRKMVIIKQSADLHSSALAQAVADKYLRSGRMPGHIEEICASYGQQLGAMLSELISFGNAIEYTRPEGGLFVFATLPETINTLSLLEKAAGRGVAYVPGTHFYCERGTNLNTMRLNFSNATTENILKGMRILKDVIDEELKK